MNSSEFLPLLPLEDILDILRQISYNLPVLIVCFACFNYTPSAASLEAAVVFFAIIFGAASRLSETAPFKVE